MKYLAILFMVLVAGCVSTDKTEKNKISDFVNSLGTKKIKDKYFKKWRRYRFYTKSINDYRPIIFNPKYPWWCSGHGDDYAVIIAYLPSTEKLIKYWDDAYDIEFSEVDKITFSDRFPKPDYFKEDLNNG